MVLTCAISRSSAEIFTLLLQFHKWHVLHACCPYSWEEKAINSLPRMQLKEKCSSLGHVLTSDVLPGIRGRGQHRGTAGSGAVPSGKEVPHILAELPGGGAHAGVALQQLQDGAAEHSELLNVFDRDAAVLPRQSNRWVHQVLVRLHACPCVSQQIAVLSISTKSEGFGSVYLSL